MVTFLDLVAQDLFDHYGNELSTVEILFPNRRSLLFFNDSLAHQITTPIWQPRNTTIEQLMQQISGLQPIDSARLIVELYKIYSQIHPTESFDTFYFWGQVLLSDFDAVDKAMIDADTLFTNLNDLKIIESDLDYLGEEQVELIKRFWHFFDTQESVSDVKRKFLDVWRSLSTVYHRLHSRLEELGCAYQGMIQRKAAERLMHGDYDFGSHRYAIVGFNALSKCEKVLFDHLKSIPDTRFYWDCQNSSDNHGMPVSDFMAENLSRYPSAKTILSPFAADHRRTINVVSTPSDSQQCKYAATFLEQIIARQGSVDKRTAIVLADEGLLMPLLYSVPESAGKVNVTMGYPLRQSMAYSFVERLLLLQQHLRTNRSGEVSFYHSDVTGLLSHPYIEAAEGDTARKLLAEVVEAGQVYVKYPICRQEGLIAKVFQKVDGWQAMADYIGSVCDMAASNLDNSNPEEQHQTMLQREYFALITESIVKLSGSLAACSIDVPIKVYYSLLRKMLQGLRIPFSGEPLSGLQVMGILETRNLDFDNLLILSMNDSIYPSSRIEQNSFIPYTLRYAYGLPTAQQSESVYAYYFYRLLSRAANITLAYCSMADDNSQNEPSRYIYQLEYEMGNLFEVKRSEIGVDVNFDPAQQIVVKKQGETLETLNSYLDNGLSRLSPSAFNDYLDCSLRFYFRSVARLKTDDKIDEEVDIPMFGNILHKAMELLYEPLEGHANPQKAIAQLAQSADTVGEAVDRAIEEEFYNGRKVAKDDWSGNVMMVRETVCKYISGSILPFDASRTDYTIVGREKSVEGSINFALNGVEHKALFKGKADRIDFEPHSGRLLIVDYKTGNPKTEFDSIESLTGSDSKKRNKAVLQTFLYCLMVDKRNDSQLPRFADICPMLYYVRLMGREGFSPLLRDKENNAEVESINDHADTLKTLLAERLTELFDPTVDFVQTDDEDQCSWCDYKAVCQR